eukprot:CAMPEP_0170503992 /NCGR_PEP_ID=MMETSP0208-20121228/46538_1 /TAXON_ID=197538 /ORGANISM="Strombidium inclinatum, Strain S3" /LENGTH=128 /DNA_ID=CAMNT_0010783969 /DNA_START=680 /DNA_END=1063 /DNA_ORIENTATION=-
MSELVSSSSKEDLKDLKDLPSADFSYVLHEDEDCSFLDLVSSSISTESILLAPLLSAPSSPEVLLFEPEEFEELEAFEAFEGATGGKRLGGSRSELLYGIMKVGSSVSKGQAEDTKGRSFKVVFCLIW